MSKNKLMFTLALCSVILAGVISTIVTRYFWVHERHEVYFSDKISLDISNYPSRGQGKIQIISCFDLMCHYCDSLHIVLDSVADQFKDDIQLVEKPYALLNRNSGILTCALLASIKQDGYWKMLNELFKLAPVSRGIKKKELLAGILQCARNSGLDSERLRRDMHSREIKQAVKKSKVEANKYGIHSIPVVFVNGYMVNGFQPFHKYSSIIKSLTEKRPPQQPDTVQSNLR